MASGPVRSPPLPEPTFGRRDRGRGTTPGQAGLGGSPGPGAPELAQLPGAGRRARVERWELLPGSRRSGLSRSRLRDLPAGFRGTPASESPGRFKGRGRLRRAPAARRGGRVPRRLAPVPGLGGFLRMGTPLRMGAGAVLEPLNRVMMPAPPSLPADGCCGVLFGPRGRDRQR